jgi:uncharacterized protein
MANTSGNFFGTGWPFPINPAAAPLQFFGGADKIRQSIYLILATAPGERPMRPTFGCGINDLVFMPNTAVLRGSVQQKVSEALGRWEPRIDVLDVEVTTPPDARNLLEIRIDYRLRSNNAAFNLVYPFFLNEGTS